MTTTINLLPWREERRERKRRFFFICLGVSGVMAVAIVIMAFTTFNSLIEHQTTRNQLIEDEIARYNQQLIKIVDFYNWHVTYSCKDGVHKFKIYM